MPARRLSRSTAGRIMVGIAVAGLVVSVAGTVVAWRLVGEVDRTLDQTLAITGDSLETIEETIALADVVVGDVASGLAELDSALTNVEDALGQAQPVLGDVAELSSDVPRALLEFQRTLDGVADAAAQVDRALDQIGSLPLTPDLTPGTSLSGQLERLSADLDPVMASLGGSSADLAALAATTEDLQADVAALAADVAAVNVTLRDSSELVGRYRQQAEQAGDLAASSRRDLGGSTALMRTLIVVGGALFGISQFVPLWVGLELLAAGARPPDADAGADDVTPSAARGAAATRRR